MILAIDAHKLDSIEPTGTDRVTSGFLQNLPSDLIKNFDKIILYTKKPISNEYKEIISNNIINKVISIPLFWSSIGLSWRMYIDKPDILFVPSHSLPLLAAKKNMAIIHDIGFLKYQQNYSPKQYYHLVETTKNDLKKANIIITPTNYVKKTLIDTYFADPNKIKVVSLGIDTTFFKPRFTRKEIECTLDRYDKLLSKNPYFLFLGRLEARKNIKMIISSFNTFKNKYHTPHILVLGGKPGQNFPEISRYIQQSKFKSEIVLCDYINNDDLPVILSQAEIFLFPSLYEGFGLPVLEAQACGTAVITSNTTALPETAGEGALLVDPDNEDDIVHAILKITSNETLRNFLIEKGYQNIQKYSWEKFSREICEILIELSQKL